MHSTGCAITRKYLAVIERAHATPNYLGSDFSRHIRVLQERADTDNHGRQQLILRGFLAVEIMATRGLVDVPLASIARISRLRWDRSPAGLTKLIRQLRAEKEELLCYVVEHKLEALRPNGVSEMMQTRRERLVERYEEVDESAKLLRRSLKATNVWQLLGSLGTALAETTEHLGFGVRVNIANELMAQTEEVSRRAWEPMT